MTTQFVFLEYCSKSAQRNKSPKHRTREGVVENLTWYFLLEPRETILYCFEEVFFLCEYRSQPTHHHIYAPKNMFDMVFLGRILTDHDQQLLTFSPHRWISRSRNLVYRDSLTQWMWKFLHWRQAQSKIILLDHMVVKNTCLFNVISVPFGAILFHHFKQNRLPIARIQNE